MDADDDARDEYLAALSLSSLGEESSIELADGELARALGRSPHGFDAGGSHHNNAGGADNSAKSMSADDLDGFVVRAAPSAELSELRASYVTIEQDGPPANLTFKLERDLLAQEVVAIAIYCVPHYIIEEDFMGCVDKKRVKGIDFIPLRFSLRREPLAVSDTQQLISQHQAKLTLRNLGASHRSVKSGSVRSGGHDDSQVHIKAALFNGTYTLVLTTPHGSLKTGQYTLLVSSAQRRAFENEEFDESRMDYHNVSSFLYHQDLRVSFMARTVVKATALPVIAQSPALLSPPQSPPMTPSSTKVVLVPAGGWVFFRVILADRAAQLPLSIHCWYGSEGVKGGTGEDQSRIGGAVDLFVTNRYDGLLTVDPSTAIWRAIGTHLRAEDGHRKGYNVLRILPEDVALRDEDADSQGDRDGGVESFIVGIRHSRADGVYGYDDSNGGGGLDRASSAKEIMRCELRVTTGHGDGVGHTIFRFDDENDHFPLDLDGDEGKLNLDLSGFQFDDNDNHSNYGRDAIGMGGGVGNGKTWQFGKEERETLLLPHGEARNFAIKFDPVERSRIIVTVDLQHTSSSTSTSLADSVQGSMSALAMAFGISLESGRRGACCSSYVPWMDRYGHESWASSASTGGDKKMLVLYLSASDAYPSPSSYTWRANGRSKAAFVLDTAEWRYLSNTCYFTAFVVDHVDDEVATEQKRGLEGLDEVDAAVLAAMQHSPTSLPATSSLISPHRGLLSADYVAMIRVWQQRDEQAVAADKDAEQLQAMRIFEELYRGVDGMRLSYKDRRDILGGEFPVGPASLQLEQEAFEHTDDASFTYDEMDFLSFRECLAAAGAVDGQIFFDLGSGVGRAMTAAALSGICFTKIVGVELLPSLVQCGRDVISELTAQSNSNANASFNSGHHRHHHHQHLPHQYQQQRSSSSGGGGNNNNINHRFGFGYGQAPPFVTGNISPVLGNRRLFGEKDVSVAMDDLSVVSSSTYSYQVTTIANLRDRLRRAKVALPLLETRHENFLASQCDWSDADLVLTCSACFSEGVMELLTQRMARFLRPGARWMTEKLPDEYRQFFVRVKDVFCHSSSGRKMFVVLERSNAPCL